MGNISYFRNNSNCFCCFNCEYHEINQRHGYIILCKNRNSCTKYQEHLVQQKLANELEKKESRERSIASTLEYERRTKRKRK